MPYMAKTSKRICWRVDEGCSNYRSLEVNKNEDPSRERRKFKLWLYKDFVCCENQSVTIMRLKQYINLTFVFLRDGFSLNICPKDGSKFQLIYEKLSEFRARFRREFASIR
jgi:hypothetical protein